MTTFSKTGLVILLQMLFFLPSVHGQENQPQRSTALGVRQQRVKRMMQDLNGKLQSLAQKLQVTEPEKAERLVKAFQQSNERRIEERMFEISRLLDTAKLTTAGGRQNEILSELDLLLRTLLDQKKNWDKVNQEANRLEEMRQHVRDLLKQQREHLRNTDRLVNKDKTLADLDHQIAELEGLIKRQEEINQQTEQAKSTDQEGLQKLADDQKSLRKSTEDLARDVEGDAFVDPSDTLPESIDPPADEDNSQQEPSEKNQEGKAGDGKPSEGKPGEGKPSEGKPGEGKSGESSPGEPTKKAPQPGTKPLSQAARHQKAAAQKLAQALPKDARKDEGKALAELKKALDQLREERSNIARLPQKLLDQMIEKQNATAEETEKLLAKMKETSDSGESASSKPPGQKNVQQAKQSMQDASQGLEEADADAANREQEKAVNQLKEALDEIERRLAQLREETLIDRLARLEAPFREILVRHQSVKLDTLALHERREKAGKLSRADRLKLKKLAAEEKALAEEAYQTHDILIEDGTSVVFPRVVSNLRADFETAGNLLGEQKNTGKFTQALQGEIETTLQELIEALQRNLKKKKSSGGGGNCDCEPPLLPGSAELKLLRSMQLRVNRRTVQVDAARVEDPADNVLKNEITKISSIQKEVAEMALELAEKY